MYLTGNTISSIIMTTYCPVDALNRKRMNTIPQNFMWGEDGEKMAYSNPNYEQLKGAYLFAEVARRSREYKEANPDKRVISLGIGDITLPLAPAVVEAMHKAVDDMAKKETLYGYGPYEGYDFLLDQIVEHDYKARGVSIEKSEIFVNDGAKSDTGNIGDILCAQNTVLIADPAYPVYIDTNVMSGRSVTLLPCTEETGFVPVPPEEGYDIVYLCSPNNPTGAVMNKEQIAAWVQYAKKHNAVLLFDGAYESFIKDPALPRSIYEVEGAKEVAIEFRSYSKTAGFTGIRCGYTVVPKALKLKGQGGEMNANELWFRRQSTKFNGTSYITQRGAEAVYSAQGRPQIEKNIDFYLENVAIIKKGLDDLGIACIGGKNSPYIWLRCPGGLSSWEFFDKLLFECNVIGTPGEGFGECGKGWFRLTGFGSREDTVEAVNRLNALK